MKQVLVFLGKLTQLIIVWLFVFATPALMLLVLWMNKSIYIACMHSPTYCAIMFVLASIMTYGYAAWRADRNKSSKQG